MTKRYTEAEHEFIVTQAKLGTPYWKIAEKVGVSRSAIAHYVSRRGIRFCPKPIKPIPGEIWLACPNIPDIRVSNMGRFQRVTRNSIITGYIITRGYVILDVSGVGRFYAHRLIATAFIPNPENKPEVNHIDGNKQNNRASNLEWVTPSENMQHAFRTGLHVPKTGQEHPRTALTTAEILTCVEMRDRGLTYPEIAKNFDVYWKTISRHVNAYRRSTARSEAIP